MVQFTLTNGKHTIENSFQDIDHCGRLRRRGDTLRILAQGTGQALFPEEIEQSFAHPDQDFSVRNVPGDRAGEGGHERVDAHALPLGLQLDDGDRRRPAGRDPDRLLEGRQVPFEERVEQVLPLQPGETVKVMATCLDPALIGHFYKYTGTLAKAKFDLANTDFTDTANHAANGATDGMLAIQMHYTDPNTNRWVDAGFWRWRVIAVKELPDGK